MSKLSMNNADLQEILDAVNALPEAGSSGGVTLPDLDNPGTASDLLSGKELIDENGQVVTGTIPIKTSSDLTASGATVTVPSGYYATQATKSVATATQATPSISVGSDGKITASVTQDAGYVTAGTKSGTKQLTTQAAKTVTPTTSSQTAVASGVYTTGAITVAAIPSKYKDVSSVNATAGDVLSGKKIVNSSGTVVTGTMTNNGAISKTMDGINTKTVNIPAGYTSGGTVSLDNTIDNEVDEQSDLITQIKSTAYGINSEVDAQADLISQIMNAVDNLPEAGSGGVVDTSMEDGLIDGTISGYSNNRVNAVRDYAFYDCTNLTTVSFPAVTTIGGNAFRYCSNITTASFPAATTIGNYAFAYCTNLTTASFPAATTIGGYAFDDCSNLTIASFPAATAIGNSAFYGCRSLTTISFPAAKTIGSSAFRHCTNLKSVFLNSRNVVTLVNSSTFYSTKMSTTGYFYVPSSVISNYQTATNWTYFSSRFSAIESHPDWDGVYGEVIEVECYFYIGSEKYQFEEGMTWEDWCNSEYNPGEYYVGMLSRVMCDMGWYIALGVDGVNAFDAIIAGAEYCLY